MEADVPIEIEVDGRVYDRLDADYLNELAANAPPPSPRTPGGAFIEIADEDHEPFVLQDMPRDELALALRPVVMRDGEFYVSRELEYEAADAILSGADETFTRSWVPRPADGRPEPVDPDRFRRVIGDDGRSLSNTSVFPWNAITRVVITMNTGAVIQCSGSFVGPYTFLTAAHCVVGTTASGGYKWMTSMRFEPGRQGSSNPTSVLCNSSQFTNWGYPVGFLDEGPGSSDNAFDYAVIDVWPCIAPAPAFFTSYEINPPHSEFGMYGYPGQCPGGAPAATSQCGMTGAGSRNGWRLESDQIDTSSGQSGGPWYQVVQRPVIGIHRGYREYYDFWQCGFSPCRRNYARRIDSGVDGFIRAISWDW